MAITYSHAAQHAHATDRFAREIATILGVHCALAAADAWPEGLSDEEILAWLLGLNLERAGS